MYDPVCGMKLDKKQSVKGDYKKKSYAFCSKECKDEFLKKPKKYLEETPIIEFRDVHKDFNLGEVVVPVLRGLSLKIWKNDFIALIGSSGSGKSTAMNIMGALDTSSSGKVFVDGKNVSEMSRNELSKIRGQKIGFVFQQFNLLGALNCKENVALPLFFKNGNNTEKGQKNVDKYIRHMGIAERADHKPLEMSGGEQQRAAIARALVNDPELVLADEPTGNLDSETGKTIMELLKDLNKNGTTLVIVTHDPTIAKNAHRIIKLKDGQLVQNHNTSGAIWSENGLTKVTPKRKND